MHIKYFFIQKPGLKSNNERRKRKKDKKTEKHKSERQKDVESDNGRQDQ